MQVPCFEKNCWYSHLWRLEWKQELEHDPQSSLLAMLMTAHQSRLKYFEHLEQVACSSEHSIKDFQIFPAEERNKNQYEKNCSLRCLFANNNFTTTQSSSLYSLFSCYRDEKSLSTTDVTSLEENNKCPLVLLVFYCYKCRNLSNLLLLLLVRVVYYRSM